MKRKIVKILGAALCCAPLSPWVQTATAQTDAIQTCESRTQPVALYHEGQTRFAQKAFAAVIQPLTTYLQLTARQGIDPTEVSRRQEAVYMLTCAAYELHRPDALEQLQGFLRDYPTTPHANRIRALIASCHFFECDYAEALNAFQAVQLEALGREECADMTYRMATCYLQTGQWEQAATWFEVVRTTSLRYQADCIYYLSYIRYTRHRFDEALQGFLIVKDDKKYASLVPYYLAEIHYQKGNYAEALRVADDYQQRYPGEAHVAEMDRIIGMVRYQQKDYFAAMTSLDKYLASFGKNAATSDASSSSEAGTIPDALSASPRRDARYMAGLSRYHSAVYSTVAEALMPVTSAAEDALTQNAFLHMGLAYLQLGEKTQARMAFEQAAVRTADLTIKEQAAYNHALCIHETSYSAFGESVTVFEKFLNEFPRSAYADQVSSYLVDVYMTTRSYETALQSINRIARPTTAILEAKQKILFQLGTQSFANARFAQATDYLRSSIALGQYNRQTQADAYYWLGEAAYRQGQYDEAAAALNQYLTYTPRKNDDQYALASYNLGYIAFHRKQYQAAESRFVTYVSQQQGQHTDLLADTYNRLGDCCLQDRRFEEAATYYGKTLQLNAPVGDYATYQIALVAGLQRDYAAKVNYLNRLAQNYPTSPYVVSALYEKGRSYVQTDERAQAISTFNTLVEKYPESPVARKAAAEVGLLYYQAEDYDHAIAAYKQVITRYPGSEEARLAMLDLKNLYVDANRVDEFAALAQSLPGNFQFASNEQDSLTYVAAERVYMKGDHVAARQSFTRYLQSYPTGAFNLNAHYYLCQLAYAAKEQDEVMRHADYLMQYPDNPYSEEVLLMRSEMLFNKQDYRLAMGDYRQLEAKASTEARRQLGALGVLRCASLLQDHAVTIQSATRLLAASKLSPEQRQEALYRRAKAYLAEKAVTKAEADFSQLATDTRTLYGAEAKYQVAQLHFNAGRYTQAEKEILNFIDQSTPHAYWLARSFVLLSDVYVKQNKPIEARQYLLSLQQNYQAEGDIAEMIEERLNKLKE